MDQLTPEARTESEAVRDRVRRIPGVVFHESTQRTPFVPEIWVDGHVDIEDLLCYDEDDDDEVPHNTHPRTTGS